MSRWCPKAATCCCWQEAACATPSGLATMGSWGPLPKSHLESTVFLLCTCNVQFLDLTKASSSLTQLMEYISRHGPGCLPLVRLLLEAGADPNALAGVNESKVTPLHMLCCFAGGGEFSLQHTQPMFSLYVSVLCCFSLVAHCAGCNSHTSSHCWYNGIVPRQTAVYYIQ